MFKGNQKFLLVAIVLMTFPASVAFGVVAGRGGLPSWGSQAVPEVRLAGPPPLLVRGNGLVTPPGGRFELRAVSLPPDADEEEVRAAVEPGVSGLYFFVNARHFMNSVEERGRTVHLVAAAVEAGVYPVLAATEVPASACAGDPAALSFWEQLAQTTATWPGVVFDVGDAGCGTDWEQTRAGVAAAIDAIRAGVPAALIVVAAPPELTVSALQESPVPRDGILYRGALPQATPDAPPLPPDFAGLPVILEPAPLPATAGDRTLYPRAAMSDLLAAEAAGWRLPYTEDPGLVDAARTVLAGAARWVSPEAGPLPRLRADGNRIADTEGKTVRLAGFNRPGLEVFGDLAAAPTQADLDRMAAVGANLLRLPVNPVWYRTRPDYRATVFNVIGWAEERRIYTLLDLHWSELDGRSVCKPEMGNATRFWQEAAFDLRGRTSVIYDIYNEPCQLDWATWRPMAEQLVDAVRRVEPDALVVVPGVDWAYDLRGVADDPVQRDNIIYGAHDYPWKAYLDRERAYGYLADRYPVLLGEFGADYKAHYGFYQDPVEFTRGLLDFIDRRGLVGWAAWAWHADITPNMFSDWNFTPTPFGQVVLDHLAAGNAATRAAASQPASAEVGPEGEADVP